MADLRLAVKREYFEQIKQGCKNREYRLVNDYWTKRLQDRNYETVTITMGYPKRGNTEKELKFKYRGYETSLIQHKHFGPEPVLVFGIILYTRI